MQDDRLVQMKLRKAVVLCVDETFLPYALFLADQLHQKEEGRDFDICLVSDAPLEIPAGFERLRLVLPSPVASADYDRLRVTHLARSAYLRLWAPHILADQYDRLIYLDSDMFVDAGGLSRLFEADMQDKPVAAVRDVQQWYRPLRTAKEFSASGQGFRKYLNSGLLLIDTSRYLAERVLERSLKIGLEHPEWVLHHDQSLLNLALAGEWAELSPVWNWQIPVKYPLFTDWAGARIVHFFGSQKPWNDPRGLCPERFRISYDLFLSRHFPEVAAPGPGGLNTLRSPRRMAWMVIRFLALRPRIMGYLAQFPDPYKTI